MERKKNARIRPVRAEDAEAIAALYAHYVLNTSISFEEEAVSARQMAERINEVTTASLPWLVAEQSGQVVGYAYATKWKARSAYRFTVESTVYLDPNVVGQGLGSMLYEALFASLRTRGVHSVIAGIALPNPASIALHEHFGFRKVAHFKEVGFKFKQWLDVGYWQAVF